MINKRYNSKLTGRSIRLYLILDAQVNSYDEIIDITKQSIDAGVDIIQLRDKSGSAKDILALSRRILNISKGKVPFIVNDRVDLAMASGACGVHLGQDDCPIEEARRIMGTKAIIGVSCQTLVQAEEAQKQGADYIGFGSVFKTLTKPERDLMDLDLLQEVHSQMRIPIFAIGGINLSNVSILKQISVQHFAVCRCICLAANITEVVKAFKKSNAVTV